MKRKKEKILITLFFSVYVCYFVLYVCDLVLMFVFFVFCSGFVLPVLVLMFKFVIVFLFKVN